MKYLLYKGSIGFLTVILDSGEIKEIRFGQPDDLDELNDDQLLGIEIITQLDAYFSGLQKEFSLDFSAEGTDFQNAVWERIEQIPYGETKTYSQIARELGKPNSARAVGNACNKNPIPILIPCHRVVGSDGKLTGYAGGVGLKKTLLEMERNYS
ncbi:MAG TPA: methylated-DNA--[protein]-cysteine S-methyltransferase [Clostridia bacterium]|nr:methylated-DNA--[protein]-cysteine S-methyltransferase [Clostridia bacterium]